MNHYVRLLVRLLDCPSVGCLVGWSVAGRSVVICGQEVTLPCSYRNTFSNNVFLSLYLYFLLLFVQMEPEHAPASTTGK